MELTDNYQRLVLEAVEQNGYYHFNGMHLHLVVKGEYVVVDYSTGEYIPQWDNKAETYTRVNSLHPAPKGIREDLMQAYGHSMVARRRNGDILRGRYPHRSV